MEEGTPGGGTDEVGADGSVVEGREEVDDEKIDDRHACPPWTSEGPCLGAVSERGERADQPTERTG